MGKNPDKGINKTPGVATVVVVDCRQTDSPILYPSHLTNKCISYKLHLEQQNGTLPR